LAKLDKQQETPVEEDEDDDIVIEEPTQESSIDLRLYLLLS
jgi:hypothetical protein